IVLDRRLDLDAHQRMFAKSAHDLGMRNLGEIGLRQDSDEFIAQGAVGRIEVFRRAKRVRTDLGIKVEICLAQPVEFVKIAMMKNRRQSAGEAPKLRLLATMERAVGDKAGDDVRFSQRDETVPLSRRGCLTKRLIHRATATNADGTTVQTSRGAGLMT